MDENIRILENNLRIFLLAEQKSSSPYLRRAIKIYNEEIENRKKWSTQKNL